MRSRTVFLLAALFTASTHTELPAQSSPPDLSREIAEVMSQGTSGKAHQRFVHAKGLVCAGTFEASARAAEISRAAHFRPGTVPVVVRFSDGAPDISVADNSTDAAPRGFAIRFGTGRGTDILAISHNGFVVGTGEDFLALQKAIAATDSSKPHPWPIETFLGGHPKAMKFVQDLQYVPASFAAEAYFSNNALIFINDKNQRRAGRYQIVPLDGVQHLTVEAAKDRSPNFLREELAARLAKSPVRFRLLLQLASAGDPANDGSVVWPEDRTVVELGMLTIVSVDANSAEAERKLAFDPTRLVDGIELSDDPLPALRSRVYAFSVAGRQRK